MVDRDLASWENPWVRDFRATNRARPDDAERGLASVRRESAAPAMASRPSPRASGSPVRETAQPPPVVTPASSKTASSSGLSHAQQVEYRASVERAAGWLPNTLRQWEGFVDALHRGKSLPPRVTRALEKNFGWTNTAADNKSLPNIQKAVADLESQLHADLPAIFHAERAESPMSAPKQRRWIRAKPLIRDDGTARGLILFPDFFNGASDARARTVIHEVLHTLERPGGWDWHDVAQEDQPKERGRLQRYLMNPASYAGFIHDLGE